MFSNIFPNFCVCMLTHKAFNNYYFYVYFSYLFVGWTAKVFPASMHYVGSWSAGIQDWIYFLGHTWKSTFVDFVNFFPKSVRPAQTFKPSRRMHTYGATEQDISMDVNNAVNSQRVIWFMQVIYYEWLTLTVLWMNSSNLHLMWSKRWFLCCTNFCRHVANVV